MTAEIMMELTFEMKSLSRQLESVEQQIKGIVPQSAEDYVRITKLERQAEEIRLMRNDIANRLLQEEKEAEKRAKQRAADAAKQRDELLEPLLAGLEKFTGKVRILEALGADFNELMVQSSNLERLNGIASRDGHGRPLGVVFPSRLQQHLRSALINAFGPQVMSNVRPLYGSVARGPFDLTEVIAAAREA